MTSEKLLLFTKALPKMAVLETVIPKFSRVLRQMSAMFSVKCDLFYTSFNFTVKSGYRPSFLQFRINDRWRIRGAIITLVCVIMDLRLHNKIRRWSAGGPFPLHFTAQYTRGQNPLGHSPNIILLE